MQSQYLRANDSEFQVQLKAQIKVWESTKMGKAKKEVSKQASVEPEVRSSKTAVDIQN